MVFNVMDCLITIFRCIIHYCAFSDLNSFFQGYTEVIVYVTDINDNSPIFTEEWYNGTVLENSPDDTEVNIVRKVNQEEEVYRQNLIIWTNKNYRMVIKKKTMYKSKFS